MGKLKILALTWLLVTVTAPAYAAAKTDDGSSPALDKCLATGDAAKGVTSAMVSCTDSELKIQDAKLNATYKALMASLDPDQKPKILAAQRAWITFRDTECDAENQTGGTMDEVGIPACHLQMTVQRTKELQDMKNQ